MKITKRQLRRIIQEAMPAGGTFSPGAIQEFDDVIQFNYQRASEAFEPETIEMHEEDAQDLEAVMSMAVQDKAAGEPMGSKALRDKISRLDTMVRDQIPAEIYYWSVGERV